MADALGNGTTWGLTILTVAEVPNLYSGLLPSLFTISTFREDEEHTRYWIRRGEVLASVLSLAIGLGAALLSGSWLPFLGVIGMMIYLLAAYEHALKKPANRRDIREAASV
jgi:hypothetical protein